MLVYQTMQFGPSLPNEEIQPVQLQGAPAAPQSWFERVRPHCNPVEVEVTLANDKPPADWNGQAHAAACFALAGKIQKAAARIDALDQERWPHAAYIVFNAGHGVADAGDDESAGPIMELVLRYVPNHYMALYHAGMAEYRLGQHDLARRNLQAFLREYAQEDGWRSSARSTLRELGVKVP
jgi:hypothetical protein